MTLRTQTILLAAAIITTALFLQSSEISNGAAMGIILGMTGAAIGLLSGSCARQKERTNGAA